MGGGVNPIEWVLPPLAVSHLIVDQAARAGATGLGKKRSDVPGLPNSTAEKQADAEDADIAQRELMQKQADDRLALEPKPETAQDVTASRQRAIAASEQLGGARKRRASQSLTDPGRLLGGGYAGSYGP